MLWAEQYTGYIPFCPKASPLSTSLTADTQGWVEGREETAVMAPWEGMWSPAVMNGKVLAQGLGPQ